MTIQMQANKKKTSICPRCTGKGYILCPKCQGTGDERNAFFVATGPCRCCQPIMPNMMRGFVACPQCQGEGALGSSQPPNGERGLRPIAQSSMSLWTCPSSFS